MPLLLFLSRWTEASVVRHATIKLQTLCLHVLRQFHRLHFASCQVVNVAVGGGGGGGVYVVCCVLSRLALLSLSCLTCTCT